MSNKQAFEIGDRVWVEFAQLGGTIASTHDVGKYRFGVRCPSGIILGFNASEMQKVGNK